MRVGASGLGRCEGSGSSRTPQRRSGGSDRSQARGEVAAREVHKWMMKYRSMTYAGLYFHVVVAHPLPGCSLAGGRGITATDNDISAATVGYLRT